MPVPGPHPRLHGRDDEIAVLREALDRTTSGKRALVLVKGEAGIGKTRLLSATLQMARDEGAQVVAGRAEEHERTRPFGLWAEMLRCSPSSDDAGRSRIASLLAPRQHMAAPITVTSDPGLQFQVVDAFVDLIEELAHEAPLMIGLDDLQWADPSSLLTTAVIARRLTQAPVAIIACIRSTPRTEELRRTLTALDAAGARTVRLDPLSDQAIRDLVVDVLAAAPGERLLASVAGAGGNPLFATELLAALVGDGAVETVDGRAEVVRPVLPPSLRMAILRHLSFLPAETLETLCPAAILGTSFTIGDLSTTTSRAVIDLADTLAVAIAAGLLVDDGQRLRFRHDLIRDAIYSDIPSSVRLALHREAGRRLASAAASALQVAEHLARGGPQGDPEVIGWLTRAAREAAPTSPEVAAGLLREAIDLTDPGDHRRDALVAERASSLCWAGHVIDAQTACRDLLSRDHDPQIEEQVRICLARTLIAEGRMADGLAELDRVLEIPALTVAGRAAAWGWASMAHGSIGDLDAAEGAAIRARAAASADEHVAISLAMNSLAAVAEHRGQPDRALRLIDDAVAVADRSPERFGHRYPVHATRGHILMELDRLDDARSTLQTGQRICEALGTRWAQWRKVIAQVEGERRCIAMDLPLHGQTPARPGQDFSLGGLAGFLADLCDALGLDTFDLVANDTGGAVAQIFAARHPRRLRTLTLTNCETHYNVPPPPLVPALLLARARLLAVAGRMLARDLRRARARIYGSGYQDVDRLPEDVVQAWLRPLLGSRTAARDFQRLVRSLTPRDLLAVEPDLARLRVPTLIVWGDDDMFFDRRWAYWLRAIIPGAREVVEVPGGRLFFPDERPDELVHALRAHWHAAGTGVASHGPPR